MLELIGITLAITLGCNVVAGIVYVTLYMTSCRAGAQTALTGRIHLKRLPLITFNLTILTTLTVVGLIRIHGIRLWMAVGRW